MAPAAIPPSDKITGSSSTLTEWAERFVSWWIGELRGMVPSTLLARRPRRPPCPVEIFIGADDVLTLRSGDQATIFSGMSDDGLASHLASTLMGRTPSVRIDVPRSACLVRKSFLPRRALRDARKLLALEAAENTPLAVDDVYADWYVEGEDPHSGQLLVRHVLLARPRIAAISAVLNELDLPLARVTVGHGEGRPLPVELLSGDEPGLRAFLRNLSVRARIFWATALVLVCVLPLVLLDRMERQTAWIQTQRAAVMQQLGRLPAADPVAMALAASPPLTEVLDAISDRLPSSVTFESLALAENRLTVTLATGEPAALRAAVQGSDILTADPSADAGGLTFTVHSQGQKK